MDHASGADARPPPPAGASSTGAVGEPTIPSGSTVSPTSPTAMNQQQQQQQTDSLLIENAGETRTMEENEEIPPCPEEEANFISRLLFWWMNGLINKGYRKILEFSDLPGLRREETAELLADQFREKWYAQKAPKGKRSLLLALHQCYGTRFYLAALIKIGYDMAQLSTPIFVKWIIEYISDLSIEWYWGYVYVGALLVTQLLGLLLVHQYFHVVQTQGIRLRTGLRTAIFEKISKISNNTRQKMNTGEITNLYSIDAQRLSDLLTYLHMIWSSLFQMSVSLILLFVLVGWSTAVAIVLMFAVIPMNGFLSRILQKLRRATLKWTGERIKTVNEILQGIRVIKLYAWTKPFLEKAFESRASELQKIRRASIISLLGINIMSLAPLFISVTTFTIYSLLGNTLTAAVIFPALSYFNLLRFPMQFFPTIVTQLAEAKVSVERLEGYLNAPELPPRHQGNDERYPIKVIDGDFAWDDAEDVVDLSSFRTKEKEKKKDAKKLGKSDKKKEAYAQLEEDRDEVSPKDMAAGGHDPEADTISSEHPDESAVLRNINVNIEAGKLTAIVGLVGSGKSSMLSAILGEMRQLNGTTEITGSIAYAPQQAWIQTGTVRENILFGKPMVESKYNKIVDACCLTRDLEILPAGDETEIGEKGINLSGGQRQRISLARCLYADTDMLLLDDVLSAVDAHVGKRIFYECISHRGLLANKTRVLVTHQWHFLNNVDHIIVFQDGQVSEQGSYQELVESGQAFSELLSTFTKADDGDQSEDSDSAAAAAAEDMKDEDISIATDDESPKEANGPVPNDANQGKIIQSEERAEGTVKLSVYVSYFKYAGGILLSLILVGIYAASQSAFMGTSIWLAYWTSSPGSHTIAFFLVFYLAIGATSGVLQIVREVVSLVICLRASRRLHDSALKRVVHAPVVFFDSTPIGRIINRFAKDTETIDTTLINNLKSFLWCLLQTISTLILIIVVNPLFIVPLVPIAIAYYIIQRYYRRTSRELKRLDSLSRSPMFSHFGEALVGISTIRAFDNTQRFNTGNEDSMNQNNRAFFYQIVCQRWIGLRLEFLGFLVVFFTALFAVFFRGNEASVGLSLTYALQITGTMNWLVRMIVETENAFNAVERVLYYCQDIPQEPPSIIPENRPDSEWPKSGNIEFENVVMRYRPELDPVLKGLSVDILGSEKIGVVGRTGAGKSTLCSVIFRLVEIESGSISIDGMDIGKIGLDDLRSRLSIIPQDPVLFSGTIRFNLDPFTNYSDRELWQALERSHLKDTVEKFPLQLEAPVAEYGENFSVGQRQLLCLARAILKKTKVLILDEASGSLDMRTDALIQQTVRTEFADRTVLTVAHRLNTIIDSDRIMVLDAGMIVDMDRPKAMLDNSDSAFYELVAETGASNAQYLLDIARGNINVVDELEKMIMRSPSASALQNEEEGDEVDVNVVDKN